MDVLRTIFTWIYLAFLLTLNTEAAENEEENYAIGSLYKYSYRTSTEISKKEVLARNSSDLSLVRGVGKPLETFVISTVQVAPIWRDPKFPEIKLIRVQVNDIREDTTDASVQNLEALFKLSYGKIEEIYLLEADSVHVRNFLKGVVSLFQFQSGNSEGDERDVSGDCFVTYVSDRLGLYKSKSDCSFKKARGRKQQLLDVQNVRQYSGFYKLRGKVIDSLIVGDTFASDVTLFRDSGFIVRTRQELSLSGEFDAQDLPDGEKSLNEVIRSESKRAGKKFVRDDVQAEYVEEATAGQNVKNLVALHKRQLRKDAIASVEATKAFLKLSDVLKTASKATLTEILKDKKNKDIIPQLLDILGCLGTQEAFEVVIDLYKTKQPLVERYLWSLAQSSGPEVATVEKLLQIAEKEKMSKAKETMILAVAKIANNLADRDPKVTEKVLSWLLKSLKSCQDESCQIVFIRSFRNLPQSSALESLMEILIRSSSKKVSQNVLTSLQMFPVDHLDNAKLKRILVTLFSDLKADSVVRSKSAEILLQTRLSPILFKEMIEVLSKSSKEFAAFCLNRIFQLSSDDATLQKLVLSSMKQGVINWNILSHGGFSTAFTRVIAETSSGTASFNFGMEMSGMVFKRSSFEVVLSNDESKEELLQLDIFAGGLSSYIGSSADPDDDPDANAGMELRILGHSLRPFIFFESTGDLMGLYWSGEASKKNSALQGTQLIQDSERKVVMANGAVLGTKSKGCVSYDFSGMADISLWEKTSKSLVESSAALDLLTDVRVHLLNNGDTLLSMDMDVTSKSQLNLENELDFSDGNDVKLCIRMHVPQLKVKATTKMGLRDNDEVNDEESVVPGRTLFLNEKNSELCNIIYPKQR